MKISGSILKISKDFLISKNFQYETPRLDSHIQRFPKLPSEDNFATVELTTLHLHLEGSPVVEKYPSIKTNYSYQITVKNGQAVAAASSEYGLMYALESFRQMVELNGSLPGNNIEINDSPMYSWRGLMIDTGRRFVPLSTVKNLMDTMAAVKLNVLHLHASDMCRFSVESKLYPNLTSSLSGIYGGFYTQIDIQAMIEYASNLGIRVVPEFDVPGHARNMRAIESEGVEFCRTNDPHDNQLYNDPTGNTYKVVHDLLQEMSGLFVDEIFNIGCDETAVVDRCSLNSTFEFERKLFRAVANDFNKTPSGWEEAAFDAGAATSDTIVDGWSKHLASEIIAKGWRAIESHSAAFYMTEAAPGGPKGWDKMWFDISQNIPAYNLTRLLGGEISMWTGNYQVIHCFHSYMSS
jgi:hexosaminidase